MGRDEVLALLRAHQPVLERRFGVGDHLPVTGVAPASAFLEGLRRDE